MLDLEDYKGEWILKKTWYEVNFPAKLITTKESSTLSKETKDIVFSKFGVKPVDAEVK